MNLRQNERTDVLAENAELAPPCEFCNDTGWVDNYVDGCAQSVPTSCPLVGTTEHPAQQPRGDE